MFIRNAESIKVETYKANDTERDILQKMGKSPLSYKDGKWIFKLDEDIKNMLQKGGVK